MRFYNVLFFLLSSFFTIAQDTSFVEKTPTDLGLFLVKTEDGKMGVVDDQNNIIIPLESDVLWQWFLPKSNYFIRRRRKDDQKFHQTLYDSTGHLLYSNVNVKYVTSGSHKGMDDNSHRDYFMVEQQGKSNKLIFHKKRGQIGLFL